jgi:hypothetical protein
MFIWILYTEAAVEELYHYSIPLSMATPFLIDKTLLLMAGIRLS